MTIKNELVKAFQSKKARDYTYAIMFFVVASFFLVAVIRPVLAIAVTIRREGKDLKNVNAQYEKNIVHVLQLQSDIEAVRPRRYLLDEALPDQPQLQNIIGDIQRAADESGIEIKSVQLDPLELKRTTTLLKKRRSKTEHVDGDPYLIGAQIELHANYENVTKLLEALVRQRRMKSIKSIQITQEKKPKDAAEDAPIILSITIDIESYYLPEVAS